GPTAGNSASTRPCRRIWPPCSTSSTRRLRQREAGAAQGARQPDQRETDEGARVGALDALEQGRPEGLRLEAARAVERFLPLHIARNLSRRQRPEVHGRRVDVGQAHAGAWFDDGAAGVEPGTRATERRELRPGGRGVARLVEDSRAGGRYLVAPDDDSVRVSLGDRERFDKRQAGRPIDRKLSVQMSFRDFRSHRLEFQLEALQELAPIGGGGGEDQRVHGEFPDGPQRALSTGPQVGQFTFEKQELTERRSLTCRTWLPIIRAPCRRPGPSRSISIGWLTGRPTSTSPFQSPSCLGYAHGSKLRAVWRGVCISRVRRDSPSQS